MHPATIGHVYGDTAPFCALALTCVLPARAQTRPAPARIGYMALPTSTPNVRLATFRQSLRDLGYVEGKDVVIEYRDAGGNCERLPAVADELVRMKVNVIVADDGTPSVIAARNARR